MATRPNCLVIDGHPLVRLGMRGVLDDRFEVHETASREEGLELIRDLGSFDVAIVDLRFRVNSGLATLSGNEAIRAIRKAEPTLGIVAHGERPERHTATAAMQAGASAYVARTASAEELRRAVDAALAQKSFLDPAVPPKGSRGKLTRRQLQILQLLADGESTTAASRVLGLSEETVKTHTKNVLARLEARNRTHAVAIALRESLIE
ncbi:MAG TPA: response regulator transcription factor [Solirubrobacterales bacterium]|nr:response regulator transcription factor [Solirubrobacterales bacterium]